MKLLKTAFQSVLLFLVLSSAHAYEGFKVDEIVRVYDGDTITVNIHAWPVLLGHEIGIRIRGIDTPEIRGECEYEKEQAKIARDFVRQKLDTASDVRISNLERGKYFRIVSDVHYDGRSIAEDLLNQGLAEPYDGGTKDNVWCE